MFVEKIERTKPRDPVRAVPYMYVSYVATGDTGVIVGVRCWTSAAKHHKDSDQLRASPSDDDRRRDRNMEPIRSAHLALERRTTALTQANNVAPSHAVGLDHIGWSFRRHEGNPRRPACVQCHVCAPSERDQRRLFAQLIDLYIDFPTASDVGRFVPDVLANLYQPARGRHQLCGLARLESLAGYANDKRILAQPGNC